MAREEIDQAPDDNDFGAWVTTHDRGRTNAELSDELHQLIAAVLEFETAGSVTLKVNVKPMDADARQLIVTAEVSSKIPRQPARAGIFFADNDNRLTRDDPSQTSFTFIRGDAE